MRNLILLFALLLSLNSEAQPPTMKIYLGSPSANSFQIGNVVYPLNSVILIRSKDVNSIGFAYSLIPPSTYYQFQNIIVNPVNYKNFIRVPRGVDTNVFRNATAIVSWFDSFAVSSTGNIDMQIGEQVILGDPLKPLSVDVSGNLAQYNYGYALLFSGGYLNVDSTKFVRTVTSSDLSPLLTSSVTSTNNKDTIRFTLSNATANRVFAGPSSGSAATPSYRALVVNDLPLKTGNYDTTGTALQTTFHVVHGLGSIPSFANIAPKSTGSMLLYKISYNSTDLIIQFASAPGVVDINFDWFAIK